MAGKLGYDALAHVYDYADMYHCENTDKVSNELITKADITDGDFDNVGDCAFNIQSYWDIGKVFSRLIYGASVETGEDVIGTLIKVYKHWICGKIEDFNSSFYYESPQNILMSYLYNFIE